MSCTVLYACREGDVKEGHAGTVPWHIVDKGRKIDTEWYKAKILKYSGKFY